MLKITDSKMPKLNTVPEIIQTLKEKKKYYANLAATYTKRYVESSKAADRVTGLKYIGRVEQIEEMLNLIVGNNDN